LKDPVIDERIILKWIFERLDGLDRAGSGYGQLAGSGEWGDEPSDSIKCGKFLEYLRMC
jgi:hypothetical protein